MAAISEILARELGCAQAYVENIITLLDEGNTIPFIARYRKEQHGSMDDTTLRKLEDRLTYLRSLDQRRQEVKKAVDGQGKLTPELSAAIDAAATLAEVEDLYREIYARAHYSVVGAVQIDETHYTVTVNVEPMDFFTPVLDGFDDAMAGFRARWIDYVDVSRMTDEQYAAFELDWAQSVLAWCRRNLDGITYLPVQTVEISVTQDGDGLWSTDADSMQAFDEAVLYYPAYEGVLTAA